MTSDEVEVLDETLSKRVVIQQLLALGMMPSTISETTGTPVKVILTLIRRRYDPADEELASAVRMMQMNAIRYVNRELLHGTRESKLALAKIIIGRTLAKQASGPVDAVEEMRTAWMEIQEEQRSPGDRRANLHYLPPALDYDEDE